MKQCTVCRAQKPLEQFTKRKAAKSGLSPRCRDCAKDAQLRTIYGLTLDEYRTVLADQSYRCAICQAHTDDIGTLHVDHSHATGQVRGLLCGKCNKALGLLSDDVALFATAITYLSRG